MPLLFPTQGTLSDSFSPRLPFGSAPTESQDESSQESSPNRYPAWSTVEDVKSKAGTLSQEAQSELKKASQTLQAKTGKIDLYSGKYYATCILGGLVACVCSVVLMDMGGKLTEDSGCNPHGGDTIGPRQVSPSSRSKDV